MARAVSLLARMGALSAARALVALASRGGLGREDEVILAPIWKLPPEARRLLGGMWARPQFFEALGSQIQYICESAAQMMQQKHEDLGSMPLVVISSSTAHERRLAADLALSQQSKRGRHIVAPDSGHWIPLDAPQVVIDAIVELVGYVREGGSEDPPLPSS